MNFSITNGQNILGIAIHNDTDSYLYFNKPLALVWGDCRGSIANYFCLLDYDKDYRSRMQAIISEGLYRDFTDDLEGLHDLLQPLFPLFANGNYRLLFPGDRFFGFYKHPDDIMQFARPDINFAGEITDASQAGKLLDEYKKSIKSGEYAFSLIDRTTDNFYDSRMKGLYATIPSLKVDQGRISFFENEIRSGKRPFAIVFNAVIMLDEEEMEHSDMYSEHFILDGHHKLLAYQNLNILPRVALITHKIFAEEDFAFDLEELSTRIYPWQFQHLLENTENINELLNEKLEDPDSKLHAFAKVGENGNFEIKDADESWLAPEMTLEEWEKFRKRQQRKETVIHSVEQRKNSRNYLPIVLLFFALLAVLFLIGLLVVGPYPG